MRFKTMRAACAGLALTIAGYANAGLIHNNLEWMDLSITDGLSRDSVESTILTNVAYQNYRYATKSEVSALYQDWLNEQFPNKTFRLARWDRMAAPASAITSYFTSRTYSIKLYNQDNTVDLRSGKWTRGRYDHHKEYLLFNGNYDSSSSRVTRVARLDIMVNFSLNQEDVGFVRPDYDRWSLMYKDRAYAQLQNYVGQWQASILVKSASVPEPTTLAIFALGMIGLASRRFKKKS